MAVLTYAICSEDITNWGTYTAIVNGLDDTKSTKKLYHAIDDALVNRDVVEPSLSYNSYST